VKQTVSFFVFWPLLQYFAFLNPACGKVQEKIEQMKPEIRGIRLAWGAVSPATTEILGTLMVYNPNPVSLTVKKIEYAIALDGLDMGSGESTGLQIEKRAEFPLKISARINNNRIPAFWVEHLKRREKSESSVEIRVTFDLIGRDFIFPFLVRRPLETDLLSFLKKAGPVQIEKKAKIPLLGEKTVFKITLESLSGEWGEVTPEATQIKLSAIVHNENAYPLAAPWMEYTLDMNGLNLGSATSGLQFVCPPKSRGDLNITAALNNGLLDQWFVSHVKLAEKSVFNLRVALVFNLPGLDKYTFPVWEGSQTFATDILGNKN